MNKARRKWLTDTIEMLENAMQELESIRDEEQEAFDNLPDNLNDTDMATNMQENVDDIDTACSDLEDIISNIQDIIDR